MKDPLGRSAISRVDVDTGPPIRAIDRVLVVHGQQRRYHTRIGHSGILVKNVNLPLQPMNLAKKLPFRLIFNGGKAEGFASFLCHLPIGMMRPPWIGADIPDSTAIRSSVTMYWTR